MLVAAKPLLVCPKPFHGGFIVGTFNPEFYIWDRQDPSRMGWDYSKFGAEWSEPFPRFGVCDTPLQWLGALGCSVHQHELPFCVTFTHVAKDPGRAGKREGWRWHKWGDYIGSPTPKCEYLDDEPEHKEGVYVFHVYQVDNVRHITIDGKIGGPE